jgi:glycosyltransferase involved in cell wall biosynthesis
MGDVWDVDAVQFFTLRRLVPRMGIDNLIKAMSLLINRGYDCRLTIGGSGPEQESLMTMVKSLALEHCIKFIGRVPDEELSNVFCASDCFVLPTKALECFGLIVLESFACGVPVIATPVGSIPEVMGGIGHSFLTEDASPESLASRMGEFLEGRLKYNETDLRKYAETFDFKDIVRKLEEICLT